MDQSELIFVRNVLDAAVTLEADAEEIVGALEIVNKWIEESQDAEVPSEDSGAEEVETVEDTAGSDADQ